MEWKKYTKDDVNSETIQHLEKVKDSITGADTTDRIIVEIQKDVSAKPIYNLG